MVILNVMDDTKDFLDPIVRFFTNIWNSIRDFFLQYMSVDAFNVILMAIIIAVLLIIVLAIMNRD